MLFSLRPQALLVLVALSSPALCAAQDLPATGVPGPAPFNTPPPAPFVALLLPLNAPEFAAPADAVRLGRQAAQAHEPRLALQVVRTNGHPESILAEYNALIARGATVVVGPMTRTGVAALAARGEPGVPTVALNSPERLAPAPPWLYSFGLGIEAEA